VSTLRDALVRKSRRALRSARLDLRDGDTDGAVNRSYYAMFNTAQAALLSSGVPEDKLPKTHSGLISAFGERAVKSGKVDPDSGRAIRKTESLRLQADYTGVEIDVAAAEKALAGAERFVQSVEQAFGLQSISSQAVPAADPPANQKAARQTEDDSLWDKSESMEEMRRQGVENWLQYRKQQKKAARAAAEEREAARARDAHRAADRAPDIADDPDTG
jgi:uncharacterized protein (UPF0332 family)